MQIPILNGIYTDGSPNIRTSYPVNMFPVPASSGISTGFLRPADGIVSNGAGPGVDRGGINWKGVCYRVMGTKFVSISSNGVVSVLGDVGGIQDSLVTLDYSFDRIAIASDGKLFYWNGANLTEVTDSDLGRVIDVTWVDGYFMTTDGQNLIVTELGDPSQVNPLKYGASEVDPDPIVAILKLRNEVYAMNRNTIEVFDNVGGDFFPFQRIDGAQIQKGPVGTHACCVFIEKIAFLGSGRNEPPAIYIGENSNAKKISTQEIDNLILNYSEQELAQVKIESRNYKNHNYLYVHLPDKTIVYDATASENLNEHVWVLLTSSLLDFSQFKARNFVWAYDKWLVGDPQSSQIGYFVENISTHWGDNVRWEFGTSIVYNEGKGAIFNELELVALPGRVAIGINPTISTSYSVDGMSWSQDKAIRAGTAGETGKRLVWYRQGHMGNWRIQRFKGDTQAHLSFVRLEAQIEPLAY